MTLQLNGIEIEIPNDAVVDVSEDGKHVKIGLPEVVEKIRVVETPGPERVVEVIRFVNEPCDKIHYPPPHTTYPSWPTVTYPTVTWTSNNNTSKVR